jgi:hypothetical protein
MGRSWIDGSDANDPQIFASAGREWCLCEICLTVHCAHHWIVELLRHIDDLRSVALIAEARFRSGDERADKQESFDHGITNTIETRCTRANTAQ